MSMCLLEYEATQMPMSTCCREPCSPSREVISPAAPGLSHCPRWARSQEDGRRWGRWSRSRLAPSPPPHTAAEAPAGHGLDPPLRTALTLASHLNIWQQQADKGCSGNSHAAASRPTLLQHPAQGLSSLLALPPLPPSPYSVSLSLSFSADAQWLPHAPDPLLPVSLVATSRKPAWPLGQVPTQEADIGLCQQS